VRPHRVEGQREFGALLDRALGVELGSLVRADRVHVHAC
jgi:hypothetical protein